MPTQKHQPVYGSQTKPDISPEDIARINAIIDSLYSSLPFFKKRLNHNPTMEDVHTHMMLAESYLTEIARLIKYDPVPAGEKKGGRKRREADMEITRLNLLPGSGITPEGISFKLQEYDDIIRLWYGVHGFRYAKLESYTPFGMIYQFSEELRYEPDDGTSGRKEWYAAFQSEFELIAKKGTAWDIYRDTGCAELLDTDKNKHRLECLFRESFPNCRVCHFTGRANCHRGYSLRATVRFPYDDIEKLRHKIVSRAVG